MRNTIYIGSLDSPEYTFDNERTFSVRVNQKVALVGQTFSYDTLTAQVADKYDNVVGFTGFRTSDAKTILLADGSQFCIDVSNTAEASDMLNLEYGTPVWYYQDNVLVGKFYLDDVTRDGKNLYKLECTSVVGILDKLQHGGGLFTASTFGAVLQHILAEGLHGDGAPVIEYEIDPDVAEIPVSGWLPYATKRDNLYQLVFAYGVNIIKNIDGNPRFTFVYAAPDAPGSVDENIIFDEGSVTYRKPYSGVSISEHAYTALTSVSPITLFDNSTGTALLNEEIWFNNAPIIVSTLSTSGGLTVVSATENSVVLTGNGVLTGVPYTHTTRIVSHVESEASEKRIIDVTNCTMVNYINSDNLLSRLYAFYCPSGTSKLIKGSFKYTDERCGKAYRLKDKFGEDEVAYLSSMELTVSSFNKANCELYSGYEPAGLAGLYSHVDILVPTPSVTDPEQLVYEGSWTVPNDVTQFRVVLIGGGTGGSSGYPGENGADTRAYTGVRQTEDLSNIWYGGRGGAGGSGGSGGEPGRVKVFTIENATPGDSFDYVLGQGGSGGDPTGFIPDTFEQLKTALENEYPDVEYTDAQIAELLDQELLLTDWSGSVNPGSSGTASTFAKDSDRWSTDDSDGYVPTGGIYESIGGNFYAIGGDSGSVGGAGGARAVRNDDNFNWVVVGEDAIDVSQSYAGGSTGSFQDSIEGLEYLNLLVYGGSGAGAAVGVDRSAQTLINGGDPPARLIIRYQYDSSFVQTEHIHTLPDGYEYSIANIFPWNDDRLQKQVFRPENLICTGTMSTGHTDKEVIEPVQLALDCNKQTGVVSIYSVDELSAEDNIVNISGQKTPIEIVISSSRSGRHNDPLHDPTFSYLPNQAQKQSIYGSGGQGGHGGGGGAGSSTVVVYELDETLLGKVVIKPIVQSHGYGSGGGQGGQGGDGCILIYY